MLPERAVSFLKEKGATLALTPLPQLKEEINRRWETPVLGSFCYTIRELACEGVGERIRMPDITLALSRELGDLGDAEFALSALAPPWLAFGSLKKALEECSGNPRFPLLKRAGEFLGKSDFEFALCERDWKNPGYLDLGKVIVIGEEFLKGLDREFLRKNVPGAEFVPIGKVLGEPAEKQDKILPVKCFGRSQALGATVSIVGKFGGKECAIITKAGEYPELPGVLASKGILSKGTPLSLRETPEGRALFSIAKACASKAGSRERSAVLLSLGFQVFGKGAGKKFSRRRYLDEGDFPKKTADFLENARSCRNFGELFSFLKEEGHFKGEGKTTGKLEIFLSKTGISDIGISKEGISKAERVFSALSPVARRDSDKEGVVLSSPEGAPGIGRRVQILLGIDATWLEERQGIEEAKWATNKSLESAREREREAVFRTILSQGELCYPILIEGAGKDPVFASKELFSFLGIGEKPKEQGEEDKALKNSDFPEERAVRFSGTIEFSGKKAPVPDKREKIEAKKEVVLSSSSLDLFSACRRKYYYSKILGFSEEAEASEFGSLVHSIIEALISEETGNLEKRDNAFQEAAGHEKALLSLIPPERREIVREKIGRFREIGKKVVKEFLPEGGESEKWLKGLSGKFRGKLDYSGEGFAIDFKTGKFRTPEEKLSELPFLRFDPKRGRGKRGYNAQAVSYCALLSENFKGTPEIKFMFLKELDCPRPDIEGRLFSRISPEDLEYSEDNFLSLLCQKGGNGKFYAKETDLARKRLLEIPEEGRKKLFEEIVSLGSRPSSKETLYLEEADRILLEFFPGENDWVFRSKCANSSRACLKSVLLSGDLESFGKIIESAAIEISSLSAGESNFERTPFSKKDCDDCPFVDLCGNSGYSSVWDLEEGEGGA